MTTSTRRPSLSTVMDALGPALFPIISGMFAAVVAIQLISVVVGAPVTVTLVVSVIVAAAFSVVAGKVAFALCRPHPCGQKNSPRRCAAATNGRD